MFKIRKKIFLIGRNLSILHEGLDILLAYSVGTDIFGFSPSYVAPTEEYGDIPISLIFINPAIPTLSNNYGAESDSYYESFSSSKDKFGKDAYL